MKFDAHAGLKRGLDVVLVLAMLYAAAVGFGLIRHGGTFEEGTKAPDFLVRSIWDGKDYNLEKLKGKTVLLNFFSTGCPSCRRELSVVEDLQRQGGDRLKVLVVSADDPKDLKAFMAERNTSLEVTVDISRAHDAYGVSTIPYMVVIDPDGNIREDVVGDIRWSDIEPWLP